VRIVIASALLLATASCAWPPPPAATPGPVALAPAAAVPAPPPAFALPPLFVPLIPAQASASVDNRPAPPIWLGPPRSGRLTLSNFAFDLADVEAVVTRAPDCAASAGASPIDFKLPLKGTWVIPAPPGADICWRRQTVPPPVGSAAAAAAGWTPWNRVFTSSGRSIDAQL
jgi:hypothetical protein